MAGSKPETGGIMIGARDPDIAVREEFQAAQGINTKERWELFIARHPGHALTEKARTALENAPQ